MIACPPRARPSRPRCSAPHGPGRASAHGRQDPAPPPLPTRSTGCCAACACPMSRRLGPAPPDGIRGTSPGGYPRPTLGGDALRPARAVLDHRDAVEREAWSALEHPAARLAQPKFVHLRRPSVEVMTVDLEDDLLRSHAPGPFARRKSAACSSQTCTAEPESRRQRAGAPSASPDARTSCSGTSRGRSRSQSRLD